MSIETTNTIEVPAASATEHDEVPAKLDLAFDDVESAGCTAADPEPETYHYQVERPRYLIGRCVGCIAIGVCVFIVIPLIIFLAVWLTGMQHINDSGQWTNNNDVIINDNGWIDNDGWYSGDC